MNIYIHTINCKIANYHEGEQIYYHSEGSQVGCLSLKQIKKEQKLSNKWRSERGYSIDDVYGYIRVKLNDSIIKEIISEVEA